METPLDYITNAHASVSLLQKNHMPKTERTPLFSNTISVPQPIPPVLAKSEPKIASSHRVKQTKSNSQQFLTRPEDLTKPKIENFIIPSIRNTKNIEKKPPKFKQQLIR